MGFLSKLFDPGKKDRQRAGARADQATVVGGSSTGPGGIKTGFSFDRGGRASQTSDLGSFGPLLEALQRSSQGGFDIAGAGLPPELQNLFAGAIGDLSTPSLDRTDFSQQQAGLSQLFGSKLGTATADPFALGQGVSDKLRQLSERGNQNLVNNKFDQLFGSGRLGTSVGVAEAFETDAAIRDQGLKFDLAGLEAGQGIQQNALGALFGASQGLQSIGGQQFGEQLSSQQLLSQFANQRFGLGAQQQQLSLDQILKGTQIGQSGAAGAAGLSQLPLAFQQALLGAQGLKSDVDLGRSGVFSQNAANAKSPLLESINAVGQFFQPIKLGGSSNA